MSAYDTILLGSSPNALAAAAYLARAGRRVLVLERSAQIGGATATAHFADGFQADLGLIGGRLDPGIVDELQLRRHGLEIVERDTVTSLLPDGRSFTLPAVAGREAADHLGRRLATRRATGSSCSCSTWRATSCGPPMP